MRLFGKVDSSINKYDRAAWLSAPFDLSFASPPIPAGAQAPPNAYRRPKETFTNYRRLFGQSNP